MSDAPEIIDGTHTRANVRAVIKHLEELNVRGVPISDRLSSAIPAVIATLMTSKSDRMQAAGTKLALAALKHNLELASFADKAARLDAGTPTERIANTATIVALPSDIAGGSI